MFDALVVESDQAAASHVECDDGSWVVDDMLPKGCIVVVYVLHDEDGLGVCVLHSFFIRNCCCLRFLVYDDNGLVAVVVADAVELLLLSIHVLFLIGIVLMPLKEHVSHEFVCPWGMNAIAASVDGSRQRCEYKVCGALQVHHDGMLFSLSLSPASVSAGWLGTVKTKRAPCV